MSKVSHEEHLLRVAELAIDPYRDMARLLGTLCSISAKIRTEYPYSDKSLIDLLHLKEAESHKSLQDSERSLLYSFVGKEKAEEVLAQIRQREGSNE
jgi:hypothetical protein